MRLIQISLNHTKISKKDRQSFIDPLISDLQKMAELSKQLNGDSFVPDKTKSSIAEYQTIPQKKPQPQILTPSYLKKLCIAA